MTLPFDGTTGSASASFASIARGDTGQRRTSRHVSHTRIQQATYSHSLCGYGPSGQGLHTRRPSMSPATRPRRSVPTASRTSMRDMSAQASNTLS